MPYHERPQDMWSVLTGIVLIGVLIFGMVLFLGWANGLKP